MRHSLGASTPAVEFDLVKRARKLAEYLYCPGKKAQVAMSIQRLTAKFVPTFAGPFAGQVLGMRFAPPARERRYRPMRVIKFMHFRARTWLLLLSLTSCGGKVIYEGPASSTPDADAAGTVDASIDVAHDSGTPSQDSAVDVTADPVDAMADQAIEEVSSDAAPDVLDPCDQDPGGKFTCCSGKPCRGDCINGECDCYGIVGGCVDPAVCCGIGCTAAEICKQW